MVVLKLLESKEVVDCLTSLMASVFWHAICAAADNVDRNLRVIVDNLLASLNGTANVDAPGGTTIDSDYVLTFKVKMLCWESKGYGRGSHGSIEFVLV